MRQVQDCGVKIVAENAKANVLSKIDKKAHKRNIFFYVAPSPCYRCTIGSLRDIFYLVRTISAT